MFQARTISGKFSLASSSSETRLRVAKLVAEKKGQKKWFGGIGEGDHTKAVHLAKWCNTGKKRNGTHYQR